MVVEYRSLSIQQTSTIVHKQKILCGVCLFPLQQKTLLIFLKVS